MKGAPLSLEAIFRWVLHGLLMATFALMVFLAYGARNFGGLQDPEAQEIAQLGRNIAQGKGYTTEVVYPFSLALVPRCPGHPALRSLPGFPLCLALFFRRWGAKESTLLLLNALLFLAGVILGAALAARLYSLRAAWWAVWAMGLSVPLLEDGITGREGLWAAVWLLLWAHALLEVHRRWPRTGEALGWGWRVLVGLCGAALGMAALSITGLWLSGLLLMGGWRAQGLWRGRTASFLLAAGFLLPSVLWWMVAFAWGLPPWRSLRHFEPIMHTAVYPETTFLRWYTEYPYSPVYYVLAHPLNVLRKTIIQGWEWVERVPWLLGILLPGFVLHGILWGEAGTGYRRWSTGVSLVLGGAWLTFLGRTPDLTPWVAWVPVLVVWGVVELLAMLEEWEEARSPRARRMAAGALLGVLAFPFFFQFFLHRPRSSLPREEAEVSFLRRLIPPDAVGMSDVPAWMAWKVERTAIALPQREVHREMLQERGWGGYLYLSPEILFRSPAEQMRNWQEVFRTRASLPGFSSPLSTPRGGLLYLAVRLTNSS